MKRVKIAGSILLTVIILGLLVPQDFTMPVMGAGRADYNQHSFWYYPWGRSVTHKGVDIFAKKRTAVHSSTYGFVIYSGMIASGGNVVLILGPKWRMHYYAHMEEITKSEFSWAERGEKLGTVGTSGNATGNPHTFITRSLP